MKPGDVILFVDALSHGSAEQVNHGLPLWANFRHGYQPSPGLLERLTPERRNIVQPQKPT